MEIIRVSCAGLAKILLGDDKYLLIQNKKFRNQGIITYGPIGGAIEYNEEALEFLMSIDAEFEKGSDLRIHIPKNYFQDYKEWFLSKTDRETTIFRELFEEIVTEENFISNISEDDIVETYEKVIETTQDWDINGSKKTSYYFFEIFNVEFKNQEVKQLIIDTLSTNDSLRIFTKKEIETLEIISSHSKYLL